MDVWWGGVTIIFQRERLRPVIFGVWSANFLLCTSSWFESWDRTGLGYSDMSTSTLSISGLLFGWVNKIRHFFYRFHCAVQIWWNENETSKRPTFIPLYSLWIWLSTTIVVHCLRLCASDVIRLNSHENGHPSLNGHHHLRAALWKHVFDSLSIQF